MKNIVQTLIVMLITFTLSGCRHTTEQVSIIPVPVSVKYSGTFFESENSIPIYYQQDDEQLLYATQFLADLFLHTSIAPEINMTDYRKMPRHGILLMLDPGMMHEEGYRLEIKRRQIVITGKTAQGVFYGIQSLRQLMPEEMEDPAVAAKVNTIRLPGLQIEDYPAFPYRGMHLDVSRHFFPVSFIKKYLDLMALHKMNNFHWHLTEDQGWRIEILQYPKLTEVGAWRKETLIGHGGRPPFVFDGKPYGGYYTQDEIREIVEYAANRFINVIPEIELPGHALAALAAHPELGCTGGPYEVATRWGVFDDVFCAGNDKVFEFLENVLSEVVELFPSQLIHIGGDECPKKRWENCPKCQQRIKDQGLSNEYELQSYFIKRIEQFLLSKGRYIIGWDEILEGGLAPNATVMSWRGTEGGIEAARMGQHAVMTPGSHCYFDHYQADPETQPLAWGGFTDLAKVYAYNPVPEELNADESKYILGAQGNVWTEYIKTPSHAEYMAFPRAIALAEVVWSPESTRDFDDFQIRLSHHYKRLDALKVNYFKAPEN